MESKEFQVITHIQSIDYVILNTGYTYRLIKKLDKLESKLKKLDLIEENIDEIALFIRDDVYKTEHFFTGDIIAQKLFQVCDKMAGVICFKCDNIGKAMIIVKILMGMKYCACFETSTLYSMKYLEMNLDTTTKKKALVMTFDTESG